MTEVTPPGPQATSKHAFQGAAGNLPPSGRIPNVPGPRQRGALWLWLAIVLLAIVIGALAFLFEQKLERTLGAITLRERTNATATAAAAESGQQALDAAHRLDNQMAVLSDKVTQAQTQQQALLNQYQDLSRTRDAWTLSEVEEMLSAASQQLQLTGNVKLALFALQSADTRLAGIDAPEILEVRRAIAADSARLATVSTVDLTGLAIRLDDAISLVDALPLAGENASMPAAAAAPASSVSPSGTTSSTSTVALASNSGSSAVAPSARAPSNPADAQWWRNRWADLGDWWQQFSHQSSHALTGLVQVRRLDRADAMLVAPDQDANLRANVKLRLLSARLSLLSRNQSLMRADLQAADDALARYFDPSANAVQRVRTSIAAVRAATLDMQAPDLQQSLQALRQYSHSRS
ncbi:MAG: uroporphyrinogen-III C-methyltransferase [Janthinobacterium lividum]